MWYLFADANDTNVNDISGAENHANNFGGNLTAGKFGPSMHLNNGAYLSSNGDRLSLTQDFTLSLWAKVLDDSDGIIASNGQFSLEVANDGQLVASVSASLIRFTAKQPFPVVNGVTLLLLMMEVRYPFCKRDNYFPKPTEWLPHLGKRHRPHAVF